jgi:hypothetical protein
MRARFVYFFEKRNHAERSKQACSMMRGAFLRGRFSTARNQTLLWYMLGMSNLAI